jgi:hypothetical protein
MVPGEQVVGEDLAGSDMRFRHLLAASTSAVPVAGVTPNLDEATGCPDQHMAHETRHLLITWAGPFKRGRPRWVLLSWVVFQHFVLLRLGLPSSHPSRPLISSSHPISDENAAMGYSPA